MQSQQAQIETQRAKLEAEKREFAEQNVATEELQRLLDERDAQLQALTEEMQNSQNLSASMESLDAERSELQNQLQILEVERNTLRADNEALEQERAKLEAEREEFNALKVALQAERESLEKKTYELTQQAYTIEEKQRALENKQSEASLTAEENQQQLDDLQNRESELQRNTYKLQEDLATLQQQQKELSARQTLYNQQQLEFIARKNALAAQQFDFADKLSSYNAQVKLFNENLEKLENERQVLQKNQQQYEEQSKELEKKLAAFEEEKAKFVAEKEANDKERMEAQRKALEDASTLQTRLNELNQREAALNEQYRELNARASNPYQANSPYGYQNPYGYMQPNDLNQRAQADGIRLNVAGGMRGYPTTAPQQESVESPNPQSNTGRYNVGLTLFKTAFIIFCIAIFESLAVFFMKDYLGVSGLYPALCFAVGFVTFIICAILYACGYKSNVKRKKHATYVVTAAVIFVIAVIIVTMIAVYMKAQLSLTPELLSYVVIPVGYLFNILFFTAFYYAFSLKASKNNN